MKEGTFKWACFTRHRGWWTCMDASCNKSARRKQRSLFTTTARKTRTTRLYDINTWTGTGIRMTETILNPVNSGWYKYGLALGLCAPSFEIGTSVATFQCGTPISIDEPITQ